MKRLTLFFVAIVCFVFTHCKKDAHVKEPQRHSLSLTEAREFFDNELAHSGKLTRRHQLIDTPDWQHVIVRQAGDKEVLIVPLIFKKDLTIKTNGNKTSLSVQTLTKLFFYKEANNSIQAEVVTTIPDDTFLNNKETDQHFTGMVWVEAWNGQTIRNYRYAADGTFTGFNLGEEIVSDSLLKEKEYDTQWCYIDFYYCVDASGFVTCSYNFSQAYNCGSGGGNMGGLEGGYYPVYGGGGGNPGGGTVTPPGDVTVGIGLNTTILAPPEHPITDPWQYKRCFNRDDKSTFKIILYVDQPKAGTRALIADKYGNTAPALISIGSKSVGHTWITFEEKRSNGSIVRRSYGLWPKGFVSPANPSASAILGNDEEREFDVSLEIGLTLNVFFSMLEDCSNGNAETYDLNTNNCTGWALDKIYKHTSIALPETLDSWALGLGKGPTPGNLGEDIRQMDLSIFAGNAVITNVKRNVTTAHSLRNYGNCPILPAP